MTEKIFRPISDLLDNGNCEPFKAGVHAVVLTLAGVCALYNTAAWLKRRQRHLAVNAIFYVTAVWLERCHVMHHLESCRQNAMKNEKKNEPAPAGSADELALSA